MSRNSHKEFRKLFWKMLRENLQDQENYNLTEDDSYIILTILIK